MIHDKREKQPNPVLETARKYFHDNIVPQVDVVATKAFSFDIKSVLNQILNSDKKQEKWFTYIIYKYKMHSLRTFQ